MPSYKITYFNAAGRAEITRLVLVAAGQKFEDKRIEFKDWPALKPSKMQIIFINIILHLNPIC
jgi:hypothetical protein